MTSQRVEVITSVERRRRWSEAEKQAILADAASTSVSAAARKAGVAASLVFRWRRQLDMNEIALSVPSPAAASAFARVQIGPEVASSAGPGTIEIELASGARMRITGSVDVATLSVAIAALAGGRRR